MRRMYHAFYGAKTTLCGGYLSEAANCHALEGGVHTPAEVNFQKLQTAMRCFVTQASMGGWKKGAAGV